MNLAALGLCISAQIKAPRMLMIINVMTPVPLAQNRTLQSSPKLWCYPSRVNSWNKDKSRRNLQKYTSRCRNKDHHLSFTDWTLYFYMLEMDKIETSGNDTGHQIIPDEKMDCAMETSNKGENSRNTMSLTLCVCVCLGRGVMVEIFR